MKKTVNAILRAGLHLDIVARSGDSDKLTQAMLDGFVAGRYVSDAEIPTAFESETACSKWAAELIRGYLNEENKPAAQTERKNTVTGKINLGKDSDTVPGQEPQDDSSATQDRESFTEDSSMAPNTANKDADSHADHEVVPGQEVHKGTKAQGSDILPGQEPVNQPDGEDTERRTSDKETDGDVPEDTNDEDCGCCGCCDLDDVTYYVDQGKKRESLMELVQLTYSAIAGLTTQESVTDARQSIAGSQMVEVAKAAINALFPAHPTIINNYYGEHCSVDDGQDGDDDSCWEE